MPHRTTQGSKTAASTQATGNSRGPFRRAFVARGVLGHSKGTGARSTTLTRTRLSVAITATALTFLLALSATSALATTGHGLAGSFGGLGAEEGKFSPRAASVGVGLSGEVFTSDSAEDALGFTHPRLQRFNATGTVQAAFPAEGLEGLGAVAVDSAPAGGVYLSGQKTGGSLVATKYSTAGASQYVLDASLSETNINVNAAIAVDPSNGTVYVTATNNSTFAQEIDSFSQTTGAFIASFNGESGSPDGGFACPTGLAVDPSHSVYVLDPCKGRVDKYSAAGVYEATVDNGSRGAPQAVATDPKTGEVYVAEAGTSGLQIANFSSGGSSLIYAFPAANVGSLSALAVGPDGTVYVADGTNSVIDRFTPFVGPTVATTAAIEVERTSATLNGTVNAESIASKYHYEYGLENTYGSSTGDFDAGSGNTAEAAPGPVTGLVPNTLYHYRIVGSNTSGSIFGEDATFTTAAAPPTVGGSPAFASAITPTGARVHATVNPQHSLTTFRIEYGTTTAYGSSAPEGGAEVGEQSSDQAVAATLTGLEPGILYHYRVSAEDGVEGPQPGADGTFITAPGVPGGASEVTTKQATLTGTIDPHGATTTYRFNYGPSTSYGASTPETHGGSGNGEQAVSEHISGLSPGTTYHVQVVATTNGITRTGADGTFTTAPSPGATVSDPTAVTASSAVLQGAAETNGVAGSYHFEVTATESAFATSTAEQPLPAATGAQPVSASVSGLPAGQNLQVRLVVSSDEVTNVSEPASFATAPLPPESFPVPLPTPAVDAGATFGAAGSLVPSVTVPAKPGPRPLTRAQKLAKALKACKSNHNKKKRGACEKRARRTFGRSK